MSYYDLQTRTPEGVVALPLATYCSEPKCQLLMAPGTPVNKFDGATFTHTECPHVPAKRFAAHRNPEPVVRRVSHV